MDPQMQAILDKFSSGSNTVSSSSGDDQMDQIVSGYQSKYTPSTVGKAESKTGDQSYNNLCEKFAEESVYGKSGIFPSAVDAWNHYASNGKAYQGTQGAQPGDLIYFAPDEGNSGFGHVGIYEGNNKFVSATYAGVKSYDLGQWQKQTGQQLLGFVKP